MKHREIFTFTFDSALVFLLPGLTENFVEEKILLIRFYTSTRAATQQSDVLLRPPRRFDERMKLARLLEDSTHEFPLTRLKPCS